MDDSSTTGPGHDQQPAPATPDTLSSSAASSILDRVTRHNTSEKVEDNQSGEVEIAPQKPRVVETSLPKFPTPQPEPKIVPKIRSNTGDIKSENTSDGTPDKSESEGDGEIKDFESPDTEVKFEGIRSRTSIPKREDSDDDIKGSDNSVQVGFVGGSKIREQFEGWTPDPNIKVTSDDLYHRAAVQQHYTKERTSGLSGPKSTTRSILPYSGIFLDITSYSIVELMSIHRASDGVGFLDRLNIELSGAWEHTCMSTHGPDLEFGQWLDVIYHVDFQNIYYGIYNSNYPGVNEYLTTCDACEKPFTASADNVDITGVSIKSLEDIDQSNINKIKKKLDPNAVRSYKVASTIIEKAEVLPDSLYRIFYGMPTLSQALRFLSFLSQEKGESDLMLRRVFYPLSSLATDEHITDTDRMKVIMYKYMMHIRKLYVPVDEEVEDPETGENFIDVVYVDMQEQYINPIIDKLTSDDFKALCASPDVRKMLLKGGIYHRVEGAICPHCGEVQREMTLDPRGLLFTGAAEIAGSLM